MQWFTVVVSWFKRGLLPIPAKTPKLDALILGTYVRLRLGIAILAVAFPLLLWSLGRRHAIPWADSMSAYYYEGHGAMRNWFVGILWAIGAFLFLHKGYTAREDWLLRLAGVFAVCIAMYPMPWNCGSHCPIPLVCAPRCPTFSLHGTFAVSFFACLVLVSWFCVLDSVRLVEYEGRRSFYRNVYSFTAWAMGLFPGVAYLFSVVLNQRPKIVFLAEVAGIAAFAIFWFAKTAELWRTALDYLGSMRPLNKKPLLP